MALTSTVVFTATGGAYTISGVTATGSGTQVEQVSVSAPASTTNQGYTLSITTTSLQSLFLYADGSLTLKTNTTTGVQTFTMAANVPLVWVTGMPVTNPITTAVTTLYLTNASTTAAVNLYGVVNQSI